MPTSIRTTAVLLITLINCKKVVWNFPYWFKRFWCLEPENIMIFVNLVEISRKIVLNFIKPIHYQFSFYEIGGISFIFMTWDVLWAICKILFHQKKLSSHRKSRVLAQKWTWDILLIWHADLTHSSLTQQCADIFLSGKMFCIYPITYFMQKFEVKLTPTSRKICWS